VSAEENLKIAKQGYAAFTSGDAAGAMENMSDDVEWITPGNSAIAGARNGKQQVGELWGALAEKGFSTSPQYWFADGDRVVALCQVTLAGGSYDSADVLTYRDGKLVKFQSAGDTALMERVFGLKDD
jgi:hypothetical protein